MIRESSKTVFICLAAALSLLLLFQLFLVEFKSRHPKQTDFYVFYYSASSFFAGGSMYERMPDPRECGELTIGEACKPSTLYPTMNSPLHTLFHSPFVFFPLRLSFCIWSIVCIALGLHAAAFLALFIRRCQKAREAWLGSCSIQ